ncbi:MAG: AI-2E family transporter, partial [Alphaproteobacteria bacterium]
LFSEGQVPKEGVGAELARSTIQWGMSLAREALNQGVALFNLLSLLVITPIVSFYLLLDWDRMIERIDGWLPREHRQTITALALEVDRRMAGFVRGTGLVCISLGSFYAIALTLLGLEFGFIVGAIAGAVSFVPFLGFIVGFVLSGLLALVQFWPDYMMIGAVAGVFIAGQVIEGNFLTPRFVGRNVGLHPVFVIFALLAFGSIFGFVGVLIAVPMAAAIGVLVRFSIERYLASGFYRGNEPTES